MAHAHPHSHPGHSHAHAHAGGAGLLWALVLNVGITVAQVVGGIVSGSLALLADAAHNASDAAALGVAFGSQRVARRRADRKRTFGYRRAETVGALINITTLVLVAGYLMVEAVQRFFAPGEVEGAIMLVVGGIAFVEDLVSAVLLWRSADQSLNVRAAFIHMVADTAATLVVIVGGVLILTLGFTWVDPLLTLLLGAHLLVHALREGRAAVRVLMDSAPEGLDFDAMVAAMGAPAEVCDVHHVHVWRLDERRTALEAHLVVEAEDLATAEQVKAQVKQRLHDDFGIEHATLELETAAGACRDRAVLADE